MALLLLWSIVNAPNLQIQMGPAMMATSTSAVTAPLVSVMVVPVVVVPMMPMFFPLSLHQKASSLSPLRPTRVLPVLSI